MSRKQRKHKKYHGCLTRAEAKAAWTAEHEGEYQYRVAERFNCCVETLRRSYKHYGFGSPRKKLPDSE